MDRERIIEVLREMQTECARRADCDACLINDICGGIESGFPIEWDLDGLEGA